MDPARSSTRPASHTSHQVSFQPASPTDSTEVRLTHVQVIDLLKAADRTASHQYKHIPKLRSMLQYHFAYAIKDVKLRERDPVTLLRSALLTERHIFDGYNKHRLNDEDVKFKYFPLNPIPENAQQRLAHLDDDIDEDLELFPLRFEVVDRGFPTLTENIPEIYQTGAYNNTYAAADPEFVPAMPRFKQSKSRSKSKTMPPATGTATSTKNKTGRTVVNYDKLDDAPRPNLDFPYANILIPEMAAFIPNAIKSWDVLDRVCGNGLGQFIYAIMINHYRVMARGKITANSTYRMFKGPTLKRAKAEPDHEPSWNDWTPSIHSQYHDTGNFDTLSVSVAGFRTAADGKIKISRNPIQMKNLAIGVKVFPSGDDALDLTRVIQYAVDHPDENWLYPTDYNRLLEKLGGPATITNAHTDAAVVARWALTQKQAGCITKNAGRNHGRRGRLQKIDSDDEEADKDEIDETNSEPDFDEMDDTDSADDSDDWNKRSNRKRGTFDDEDGSDDETPARKPSAKRTKLAPKPRAPRSSRRIGQRPAPRPSRLRREIVLSDVESDSNSDAYDGPKAHKRKKKKTNAAVPEVRRSGRANKYTKSFVMTDDFEDDEEEIEPAKEVPDLISRYGMHATRKEPPEPVKDLDGDSSMSDDME